MAFSRVVWVSWVQLSTSFPGYLAKNWRQHPVFRHFPTAPHQSNPLSFPTMPKNSGTNSQVCSPWPYFSLSSLPSALFLGSFPPASSLGVSTKRDLYLFLLPNEQGNRYNTPGGTNTNQGNAYHYSNSNGSYYYKNDNGSTYYSDPSGKGTYSPPPKNWVLLFFPSDTRVRQNLGLNFYSILDYEGNTYGIPFACVGEFVLILLQFVSVFTLNTQE